MVWDGEIQSRKDRLEGLHCYTRVSLRGPLLYFWGGKYNNGAKATEIGVPGRVKMHNRKVNCLAFRLLFRASLATYFGDVSLANSVRNCSTTAVAASRF